MSGILKSVSVVIAALFVTVGSANAAPTPAQRPAVQSQVAEMPNLLKGMVVRPLIGYGLFQPAALNNHLSTIATNNNINSTFKLQGGPIFGFAIDYPVIAGLYLGVRGEYFSTTTDAVTVNGANNTSATMQGSLSGFPLMATTTYMMGIAPMVALGATAGVGIPVSYNASIHYTGSNIQNLPNGSEVYSDSPFNGVAAAVMAVNFTNSLGLRIEGGYRFMASQQLKLAEKYNTLKVGELLKDNTGANLKADASSLYSLLSLALTL